MTPMKLVIAVLVLFVVLSLCGIGGGFLSGGANYDGSQDSWTQPIRNALARPLSLTELQPQAPNCSVADPLHVQRLRTCSYSVAKSKDIFATVRSLPLTLTQGTSAGINLQQPTRVSAKPTVTASHRKETLDIYKDGGVLDISCTALPGNECVFDLGTKDE